MSKEKDQEQEYINDFIEWQDNQYNPGHYLDGRVPGNLLKPGKPRLVGVFLIIISIVLGVPFGLSINDFFHSREPHIPIEYIWIVVQTVVFGGFILLLFIGGIRRLVQSEEHSFLKEMEEKDH